MHLRPCTSDETKTSSRPRPQVTAIMTRPPFSLLAALLLTFLTTLALAAQKEHTVEVFAWPLTASRATALASISYTPSNATLKSYTAPSIPADESVVRVGFYPPSGSPWSGVATAASNFADGVDKKILLHLNTAGELYHVGFRASELPSSGTGKKSTRKEEGVSVEVVSTKPGPVPQLAKPVVLNEQGEVSDKEPEKNFFQK